MLFKHITVTCEQINMSPSISFTVSAQLTKVWTLFFQGVTTVSWLQFNSLTGPIYSYWHGQMHKEGGNLPLVSVCFIV